MPPSAPIIYVVDDDDSIRRAISRLLKAGGYAVRTFTSATEFLQTNLPDAPGCILLDLNMPGLNGLDLQETLRRNGCTLPIVFLSGDGHESSSKLAIGAGASGFLLKPVKQKVLFSALENAMTRAGQERG